MPVTGYLEQIIGPNRGKRAPLFDYDVTLGRSKTAYISSQDPNVSRYHCVLKYSPSGWYIKDLGSVNGTYVDDNRIPNEYVPLRSGSKIYFGPKEEAPEAYKFESAKKVIELGQSESNNSRQCTFDRFSSLPRSHQQDEDSLKRKGKVSWYRDKKTAVDNFSTPCANHRSKNFGDENCGEDGYHSDSSISSLDSLRTRIRKAKSAEKKKQKQVKLCCRDDNAGVPSTSKKLFSSPGSSLDRMCVQESIPDENNSISLLNEESPADWNLDSNNYVEPVLENTSSTKDIPCSDDLNSDSVAVHSNLLKVLEKKVNDLQTTLKTVNLKFSDTLNENARLIELAKSKEHSELKLKEEILKITEEDLICNICTEIFIKPITLGCSHTFCYYCIFEWKKKKKQCPICRERIETETTVLYMDNYINKITALLDPKSLEKRIDLMKNREELQRKKPKRKKPAKSPYSRRRTNHPAPASVSEIIGLSRIAFPPAVPSVSAARGLNHRVPNQGTNEPHYAVDIRNYIDAMDQMMNDDEEEEDDEVQEIGGFYGGYGRCYNCGRSGHWANGCPY